jgi:hypothetical protein
MIVIATKRCVLCGLTLPFGDFSPKATGAYGLSGACRECESRRQSEYKRANPSKYKAAKYKTDEQLISAFLAVPSCQSCGNSFEAFGKERIDHCHDKSHVRGVVCHRCNLAMSGPAEECISRLRGCIVYLERDRDWQSLEVSCPG